ncbi:NodB homology domain-containing protein [Mucor velutinosus]|uniref:NodB homology domain-containing protein n=1 Tax=Mucor velutinosus TaxID=708070 RepID=A0AAN7D6Z1_9FUNG|nr:NodB homology domain-containing protein [Mucor velutinosus]
MTEVLVTLPKFSQLSSRVWRVLGLNPGKFTLQGTNTYLLGAGAQKILLDCGEGKPDYLPHLETSLRDIQSDAYISDIIISHGHSDHWGGLEDILNSSTLNPNKEIQVHKFTAIPQGHHVDHMDRFPTHVSINSLVDNQVFRAHDTTLRVIYTPGHTKDHCTFLLEEEEALFTADCVLGQGTAVFDDLSEYIAGLQRLVTFQPKQLYPGHGPVVEQGTAKIQEYVDHRLEREQQVVQLLTKEGTLEQGWTPMEIVETLYKGYPESLHIPAARGIVLHLHKLNKDGKAKTLESHAFIPENYVKILNAKWYWIHNAKNNL